MMSETGTLVTRTDLARSYAKDPLVIATLMHRALEVHEQSGLERTAVFTDAADVYVSGRWGGMVDIKLTNEWWHRETMEGSDVQWVDNPEDWLRLHV